MFYILEVPYDYEDEDELSPIIETRYAYHKFYTKKEILQYLNKNFRQDGDRRKKLPYNTLEEYTRECMFKVYSYTVFTGNDPEFYWNDQADVHKVLKQRRKKMVG